MPPEPPTNPPVPTTPPQPSGAAGANGTPNGGPAATNRPRFILDEGPPDAPNNGSKARWGKATRNVEEGQFLEGPRTRGGELIRVFRIALEFIKGFRKLHFVGPCVTVFGSARY